MEDIEAIAVLHRRLLALAQNNRASLQNMAWPDIDRTGTPARIEEWPAGGAKFDLLFEFWEQHDDRGRPAGVVSVAEYSADLFDQSTARRLLDGLRLVLISAATDPSRRVSD